MPVIRDHDFTSLDVNRDLDMFRIRVPAVRHGLSQNRWYVAIQVESQMIQHVQAEGHGSPTHRVAAQFN